MLLPALQPDGKPQRGPCTIATHLEIKRHPHLFATLTTPCGYEDHRPTTGVVLEVGLCRNCGSPISRKLTGNDLLAFCLATGGDQC
jgi:hypothetical protein